MRHWLFHPLIFYPLSLLIAAAVVLVSLDPGAWQKKVKAHGGRIEGSAIILEGKAFDAPDPSPDQVVHVVREGFGKAVALHIAVVPNQPEPTPAETGVRVLLIPQMAAMVEDKPTHVRIWYRSLPINPATALAVSMQGIGPADWVIQPVSVGEGEADYDLPAQFAVEGVGLRAMRGPDDHNAGIEIYRISIEPKG